MSVMVVGRTFSAGGQLAPNKLTVSLTVHNLVEDLDWVFHDRRKISNFEISIVFVGVTTSARLKELRKNL